MCSISFSLLGGAALLLPLTGCGGGGGSDAPIPAPSDDFGLEGTGWCAGYGLRGTIRFVEP